MVLAGRGYMNAVTIAFDKSDKTMVSMIYQLDDWDQQIIMHKMSAVVRNVRRVNRNSCFIIRQGSHEEHIAIPSISAARERMIFGAD